MKNKIAIFIALCASINVSQSFAQFSLTAYIGDVNRSRAGGAAAAEDATTIYTNPAGLTRLSEDHWTFSAQTYLSSATFQNQGTVDLLGNPIAGSQGGDGGSDTIVPSIYYSRELKNGWSFGIAFNTPFGLSTEYDRNWVGRYSSIRSGIETLNVNPSLGYKITPQWSVGFGANLQWVEAQLSSAVDFGAICLANMDFATCSSLGLLPQSADGYAEIEGDDWSPGFDFGVLWEGTTTRVGFSYRSKIDHELAGSIDFTNPSQASIFAPAFTDTNVEVPITLPEIISVSIYKQVLANFAMMMDVTHTRWSRIKQFEFHYENPAQPDQTINKDWHDTTRYAIGFDYSLKPVNVQWGVAYEDSAIPDETFEPSIPISDAIWLNVGAQYMVNKNISIDLGLVHIIFKERDVNITGQFGETLKGKAKSELNVINTQLHWIF